MLNRRFIIGPVMFIALVGCNGSPTSSSGFLPGITVQGKDGGGSDGAVEHPDESVLYDFANTCVSVGLTAPGGGDTLWLRADGDRYGVAAKAAVASKFFMKASDLGTYLLYDEGRGYVTSETGPVTRETSLRSDVYEVDDSYVSGAEWQLEFSERASNRFQLRNRKNDLLLSGTELVEASSDASVVWLAPAEGCTPHPELSLDAVVDGDLRTTYEDGSLYGFVDTHSHILSNFGFGGGGVVHGAPFHRLGVEVAMGTCEPFHAEDGRADFLGSGFSNSDGLDELTFITLLNTGRLPEPDHATDGWPTFSDWPSQTSATHQTQYYRWLERAWLSGMRVVVQHAVSNQVFCDLMRDTEFQPTRYECQDMLNIDRQLVEIRNMERYIDAQSGGPGEGWFRIVESPAQAREVVAAGKLAVILGIEVPNLFECYLTPRDGSPECTDAYIEAQLDKYRDLGVRVLFPNHKFDNAFTPGDGHRGIVELGNFLQTAHWANYVQDCPDVDAAFDKGPVEFGGFNEPRDVYLSDPPNELIKLSTEPLRDLLPYISRIRDGALEGEWCQKAGLTDRGVSLINGIMARGMIPEIDHLPKRSYLDVFAMLEAADYPAAGTHGRIHGGKLYELGGVSKAGMLRCVDPAEPGQMLQRFRNRAELISAAGGFPAEGFGFDLNGLAGVVDSRFGPEANCAIEQQSPVEYPFTSYDGAVTFEAPFIGRRAVDFNTEGMIHIGLVAELVEDARRTGASNEDLDIIFKSAEAYIRMWELAEQRAAAR